MTSRHLFVNGSLIVLNSPLHQNLIYPPSPTSSSGTVSQNYLRCCLPGCSLHFAPKKTQPATLKLCIFLADLGNHYYLSAERSLLLKYILQLCSEPTAHLALRLRPEVLNWGWFCTLPHPQWIHGNIWRFLSTVGRYCLHLMNQEHVPLNILNIRQPPTKRISPLRNISNVEAGKCCLRLRCRVTLSWQKMKGTHRQVGWPAPRSPS